MSIFGNNRHHATVQLTALQVLVMGDGCPGCVDISPQQTSSGHSSSSSGLPTFESLRLKHDDAAFIFFSSGTTGPSKGVVWSDRFIQYQLLMLTYETRTVIGCLFSIMKRSANTHVMRSRWFVCHSFIQRVCMITAKVISRFHWNFVLWFCPPIRKTC